ncbi:MAG TPA: zinc-finger domain-containing protein [Stellaceae bacterium]|nr:zinc-finger domain-containing protein [Stellaceae bacterium]
MQPFEIIEVDEPVASCNGGGGPLGHPRVYLNLGPAGKVECPYCSRLFVKRGLAHEAKELPRTPGAPPT